MFNKLNKQPNFVDTLLKSLENNKFDNILAEIFKKLQNNRDKRLENIQEFKQYRNSFVNSISENLEDTKQYLKSCSESLTYTTSESKTYLYNGICYLNCPENTSNNEEKNICDCNFFGYYSETDENDYICYSEEEKCSNKIPVNDLKKCLDTIENCITKGYKIFNSECYSIECP